TRLRELLYESHVFLHPSETGPDGNQEGVPNSMLEAMASGLAVFATNHGGIPEAIGNGVSGMLGPERDQKSLARALLEAGQGRGNHGDSHRCPHLNLLPAGEEGTNGVCIILTSALRPLHFDATAR